MLKDLEKQLIDAYGETFEFVRGVRVPTAQIPFPVLIGGRWAELWFAELRAKREGGFGLSFTAERPETLNQNGLTTPAATYRFLAPVRIWPKETRRHLTMYKGAISNPQANVGDTVVLPVCVDPRIGNYRFRLLKGDEREVSIYARESNYEKTKEAGAVDPQVVMVENEAKGPVQLIQGSSKATRNASGTGVIFSISAWVEFTTIGDFNLTSQLVDAPAKPKSYPFRVFDKENPITLILGQIKGGDTNPIAWGTVEARVGDQLSFECASYFVPTKEKNATKRGAIIKVEPFNAVEIYKPSTK